MFREKPICADLSYKIHGILFTVHNELGRYRNERQYADAVEKYLKFYRIPYEREKVLPASFEGEASGRNRIDFTIVDEIILELKAKRVLERPDCYQTRRSLDAFGKKLAILTNFRERYLRPRRILNSSIRE